MEVRAVSYSSDKTLSRCEMMYHYRYERRIKPRVKKVGLYRGDWLHQLNEYYRRTGKWKSEFKRIKVKLWDKLFDEEKEDYGEDFPQSVFDIFSHYVETYAEQDKGLELIELEQLCSLMTPSGILIKWKMDALYRDRESSEILLFENKNKKAIPESEERLLQPQPHTYAYLYEKATGVHINRIVWDYVRTKPVPRPQVLKNGGLSIRKIETDQRGYLRSLAEAGIHPSDSEEWQAIKKHLDSLPPTLSLERVKNQVNIKIGKRFAEEWVLRGLRAKEIKRPLLTYTKDCKWDCDYYNLCQSDMRGGRDSELIIKKDFLVQINIDNEVKDLEKA